MIEVDDALEFDEEETVHVMEQEEPIISAFTENVRPKSGSGSCRASRRRNRRSDVVFGRRNGKRRISAAADRFIDFAAAL
ncbi:hypothetical protein FK545_00050 [Planococcus glaciei]|nr:hypothetical protein [Planococcus glaciei]QDY44515.1 hypothetical protein FK545_00050 [Planococcus glaciei]